MIRLILEFVRRISFFNKRGLAYIPIDKNN